MIRIIHHHYLESAKISDNIFSMAISAAHLLFAFHKFSAQKPNALLAVQSIHQAKFLHHLADLTNTSDLKSSIFSASHIFSGQNKAHLTLTVNSFCRTAHLKEQISALGFKETLHLEDTHNFVLRGKNIIVNISDHERVIIAILKDSIQNITAHNLQTNQCISVPDCTITQITESEEKHPPLITTLKPSCIIAPKPIPLILNDLQSQSSDSMSPESWYELVSSFQKNFSTTTHNALIRDCVLPSNQEYTRVFACHPESTSPLPSCSTPYRLFFTATPQDKNVWMKDSLKQNFTWKEVLFSVIEQPVETSRSLAFERSFSFALDDYVMHVQYGLGRFKGIQHLSVDTHKVDCLAVEYANDTLIYIPALEAHNLHFFADKDQHLSLQEMSSKSWVLSKKSTSEEMKLFAKNMIETAAKRALASAPSILHDSTTLKVFTQNVPYTLTEGQNAALNDIVSDIEQTQPMDRVLCADVAFGKTEVAMRAACIVASRGYQILVITPTVLLSLQHYTNYKKRFEAVGLKVALLNRLSTSSQARLIKDNAKKGHIDIVFTTHAAFHDTLSLPHLGMCIIDEEHLFGVAQKEYIKQTYPDAHVLSMSATPIPRTLHMSLSGMQKFSTIQTPPATLSAGSTEVVLHRQSPIYIQNFLKENIKKGQVFFLVPHIKDIPFVENILQGVCTYKILTGKHTREDTLAGMESFVSGEVPLLLSTNIIGLGIDVANANTLVVYNSHLLGLAQLYQLKGRVGRRGQKSTALFLHPPKEHLSDNAQKRLEYIAKNKERGDHIKIAKLDMQMRGSGRIVGKEQAGHLFSLGASLYQTMLAQAINEARSPNGASTSFKASVLCHETPSLPENYITNTTERVNVYRISTRISNVKELQVFQQECEEQYGTLPLSAQNWFKMLNVQIQATNQGIQTLHLKSFGLDIEWHPSSQFLTKSTEELLVFLQNIRIQQTKGNHLRYMRALRTDHLFDDAIAALNELEEILELRKQSD